MSLIKMTLVLFGLIAIMSADYTPKDTITVGEYISKVKRSK